MKDEMRPLHKEGRALMIRAVEKARRSLAEDSRVHPRVGVVEND